ncbi:MAG: hypothetical protein KGO53_06845, partial [Alphaproteobacteria bacterium]|nr:hypothetical protein [Alphaproteobacteria bacterium]
QLTLALDKAGKGNWHVQPDEDLAKSGLMANVLLEQINVAGGTLQVVDARHHFQRKWTAINGVVSASALQGPWRVKAQARDGEMPLEFSLASSAYKAGQPLKFVLRAAPLDGSLPALSFDGETAADTLSGKLALDPVVTEDGRSSLSGSFRPLAFQAKVDAAGDSAKFSAIHIVPADTKDTGTLIEGDGALDLSRGLKADIHLNAPHIDFDALAGTQSLRVWQAGGVMALLNGWMARFPDDLDLSATLEAASLTANGEKLENVSLKGTAAAGAVRVQNLEADLPGRSRMKFGGIAFPGQGAAELGGSLAFETGDARAFAEWLWPEGKGQIEQLWTGARGRLKSQSDVTWGGKRFGFQNLQYELDGLQGKGELAVTLGQLPAFNLKLAADQFDLGSYVAGGLATLAAEDKLAGLLPQPGSFEKRVQLDFGKFSLNGVEAQKLALDFDSSASGFEVKDFSIASVEGAEVKGNGLVLVGPDGPSGDVKFVVGAQHPQGLMRLLGLLPKGPDPRWTALLGQTDLRAALNLKPGKDEPQVSFSVTGSSGPFQLVTSGTAEHLTQGTAASIGSSSTLTSTDARNLLRLFGLDPKGDAAGDGQLSLTANGNGTAGFQVVGDLEALGTSAGFSGRYVPTQTGIGLAGTAKLSAADSALLMQSFGFPVATGLSGPLEAAATLAPKDNGVEFKAINFKAGKQDIKGSGHLGRSGALELDLQGGSFRLGDVVGVMAAPWGGVGSWPNGSFAAEWPLGLSGEIWLRPNGLADPLGAPLGEAVMGMSSNAEGRDFSLVARAADGEQVKLDASLKPSSGGQALQAQLRYPFLLRNIFARDGKAVGPLGTSMLDGKFTSEGRSPAVMLANLKGAGTLQSPDARINGLAPDPFYAAIRDVKSADEIQKAFAGLMAGDGVVLGQVSLPFTAKDGALSLQPAQAASAEAQLNISSGIDLGSGVISAAVKIDSKTQPDLPSMTITYQGLPGEMQVKADTAALASKLGTALINKDMAALDKIQKEQEKAAQDAAAQAEADKAKLDAFVAQRAELRLQQRMLKVFAQQRALDAARAKAGLDAAIAAGQAMNKEEKRRLLQRLPLH